MDKLIETQNNLVATSEKIALVKIRLGNLKRTEESYIGTATLPDAHFDKRDELDKEKADLRLLYKMILADLSNQITDL